MDRPGYKLRLDSMQKSINIIFTVAFALGCFGLWLALTVAGCIYYSRIRLGSLPMVTQLLLEKRLLFLLVPVPFLSLSAFITLKGKPTTEVNLLTAGILAVIFCVLFFSVALAVVLPLIPVIE